MTFKPFPELQSQRLLLRKIVEADCRSILFLRSDKKVTKFIERPEDRKTKTQADAIKFIKELDEYIETGKSISWGITLKNNPEIIGTICLWNFSNNNKTAEVGYDLDPKFQSLGIMNESLKMVINYGVDNLKLNKIEAFTHTNNKPSIKLLERNGFRLNRHRKDLENKSNVIFELKNTRNKI
ncbi:GNAT family N-acetyltransferase [Xanthomarina sp. GH4-25]|uniref:GNAT family N-acetyltransferase n=1 Tax=Xanthomarina sp. GH4-25 TaxID=3349335 RepID=UPI000D67D237|nr:GNAT family N-acetyltransferase [Flavobacteriaceae bacterium LYZ1037]